MAVKSREVEKQASQAKLPSRTTMKARSRFRVEHNKGLVVFGRQLLESEALSAAQVLNLNVRTIIQSVSTLP